MARPVAVALAITVTTVVCGVGPAASVRAEPEAPDAGTLASLIVRIAEADQSLHDLDAQIQTLREEVNKTIADLATAHEHAARADLDAEATAVSLHDAVRAVDTALERFDRFAVATYVHGPGISLVAPDGPEDLLGNVAYANALHISAANAAEDLQRARTEQTNRNSAARQARQRADASLNSARRRQLDAVAALRTAQDRLAAKRTEFAALVDQRDHAVAAVNSTSLTVTRRDELILQPSITRLPRDLGAVIDSLVAIARDSTSATAEMGRAFLAQAGVGPDAVSISASAPTGELPRSVRWQASEYVVARALSQRGVPYSWGGGAATGPSRGIDTGADVVGFDCSGLILYAFAGVGIALPHYTGHQYQAGRQGPVTQMRRGDVIFFGPGGSEHVALYLGNGVMLEAPRPGQFVQVSPVRTSGMTPYAVRFIEY